MSICLFLSVPLTSFSVVLKGKTWTYDVRYFQTLFSHLLPNLVIYLRFGFETQILISGSDIDLEADSEYCLVA